MNEIYLFNSEKEMMQSPRAYGSYESSARSIRICEACNENSAKGAKIATIGTLITLIIVFTIKALVEKKEYRENIPFFVAFGIVIIIAFKNLCFPKLKKVWKTINISNRHKVLKFLSKNSRWFVHSILIFFSFYFFIIS